MSLKKVMSGAMAVTLLGSVLAGCGSGSTSSSSTSSPSSSTTTSSTPTTSSVQELVMDYRAEPPALDVSIAESSASFTFLGAISEGLYRLDKDMKPTPGLAKELPKISADGLTYTITL